MTHYNTIYYFIYYKGTVERSTYTVTVCTNSTRDSQTFTRIIHSCSKCHMY